MSGSVSIWLYLILALNFGVSWWNARSCGRAWAESKAAGGAIRVSGVVRRDPERDRFQFGVPVSAAVPGQRRVPRRFHRRPTQWRRQPLVRHHHLPGARHRPGHHHRVLDRGLPSAQPDEYRPRRLQHARAGSQHHGRDQWPRPGVSGGRQAVRFRRQGPRRRQGQGGDPRGDDRHRASSSWRSAPASF